MQRACVCVYCDRIIGVRGKQRLFFEMMTSTSSTMIDHKTEKQVERMSWIEKKSVLFFLLFISTASVTHTLLYIIVTAAAMTVSIPWIMSPLFPLPRAFQVHFLQTQFWLTILLAQVNGKQTITINIKKERGMYKVSNLQRVSVYRLIGISSTAAMN